MPINQPYFDTTPQQEHLDAVFSEIVAGDSEAANDGYSFHEMSKAA
jgi:hypothetical protein